MQAFLYSPSPYGYHDLTIEETYLCIVGMPRNSIRKENYSVESIFFVSPIRVKITKNFAINSFKKKKLHVVSIFLFYRFQSPISDDCVNICDVIHTCIT